MLRHHFQATACSCTKAGSKALVLTFAHTLVEFLSVLMRQTSPHPNRCPKMKPIRSQRREQYPESAFLKARSVQEALPVPLLSALALAISLHHGQTLKSPVRPGTRSAAAVVGEPPVPSALPAGVRDCQASVQGRHECWARSGTIPRVAGANAAIFDAQLIFGLRKLESRYNRHSWSGRGSAVFSCVAELVAVTVAPWDRSIS